MKTNVLKLGRLWEAFFYHQCFCRDPQRSLSGRLAGVMFASLLLCTATLAVAQPVLSDDTLSVKKSARVATSVDVMANDIVAAATAVYSIVPTKVKSGSKTALRMIREGELLSKVYFDYTPAAEFVGTEKIAIEVVEGEGEAVRSTVVVTVVENTPPAPVADVFQLKRKVGAKLTANVAENDPVDADGDTLIYSLGKTAIAGMTLSESGVLAYTPDVSVTDDLSFDIQVFDGTDYVASPVTIEILANTPPAPVADVFQLKRKVGAKLNANVAENDLADADGDTLIYSLGKTAIKGMTLSESGVLTYTPDVSVTDDLSFNINVFDGINDVISPVTIEILANTPPVAKERIFRTTVATVLELPLNEIFSDIDEEELSYQIKSKATKGEAILVENELMGPILSYTPADGAVGEDSVLVAASDGINETEESFDIVIEDPYVSPTVLNDRYSLVAGETVNGSLALNDTMGLRYTLSEKPTKGTIVVREDGTFDYTANDVADCEDVATIIVSNERESITSRVYFMISEKPVDTDNDGIVDEVDLDDDNDGISDRSENSAIGSAETDQLLDTDGDGIVDQLDLDSDNDGIADIVEAGGNDANRDGIVDGFLDVDKDGWHDLYSSSLGEVLPTTDTDGDQRRDFQDLDSDNDGIVDLRESGRDYASDDQNNDGLVDGDDLDHDGILSAADTDAAGVYGGIGFELQNSDDDSVPDYLDLDSDNDELPDAQEAEAALYDDLDSDKNWVVDSPADRGGSDWDHDGILNNVDGNPGKYGTNESNTINDPYEADPTSLAGDPTDDDGDGIANSIDNLLGFGNRFIDLGPDSDGDGLHDRVDLDDDNDGISDQSENGVFASSDTGLRDTDGDGIVDQLDLDSDNDGIADIIEAGGKDVNRDGIVDGFLDVDKDGWHDLYASSLGEILPTADTDGDQRRDFQDLDSDNDGIVDLRESGRDYASDDQNNDGLVDGDDLDHDGVLSAADMDAGVYGGIGLELRNSDADSVPDYLDLDSDNDELPDVQEAEAASYDEFDSDKNWVVDSPADRGGSDWDHDGIINSVDSKPKEYGTSDSNTIDDLDANGVADPYEVGIASLVDDPSDGDGDGIANSVDNLQGFGNLFVDLGPDSDGDGVYDRIDLDDDNDGISDVIEYNGNSSRDTDGDGVIDSLDLDSDADGLADIVEAGIAESTTDGMVTPMIDANHDGWDDDTSVQFASITSIADTDGDRVPNFQDSDSDNDTVSDADERTIGSDMFDPGFSLTGGGCKSSLSAVSSMWSSFCLWVMMSLGLLATRRRM